MNSKDPHPRLRALTRGTIAAVSVAVLVSGCSAGQNSAEAGTDGSAAQLQSSLAPAQGDVDLITWNLPDGEPSSLFPANAVETSSGQVVKNLCDSLLQMDAEFNLTPSLATFEEVSPTEILYTLQGGATFWDGSPVTAEDVAYSLNRAADPSTVLSFMFVNVESIEVTGADQVTVKFSTPDSLFNKEMANASGAVMQKAFSEEAGESLGAPGGGLMCSGPFELESWSSGSNIIMNRNEDYWDAERRPFAKQVEFTFVTDATAATQALNSGEIDGSYEIPATALPSLLKSKEGRVIFGPSMQSVSLSVAGLDGVMSDLKIREALSLAIDRDALAEVVFHGGAKPNYTSLTPATWPNEHREQYQAAYDKIKTSRGFDQEAAKALVKESGYDGAPIVVAIQAGDETLSRTAQLVQQQAKDVGLNIEIESMPPLVFGQAGWDASKRVGIDLMLSENFNASQDPLEPLGFDKLPGETYNYTNYDEPEVTDRLVAARSTSDGEEQARLLIEAQEIYEQDLATIPLVALNTTTFLNNRLTGAVTSFAYWSMPSLAFVGAAE